MKNARIVLIFAAVFMAGLLRAQDAAPDTVTASQVFADLPISVLDMLDRSRRLDMLDYYAADSIAKVPNAMGGQSYLDKVTGDYLKVNLTPVSTLTIKVLPYKKGHVIVAAYTVGDNGQAHDTDLRILDAGYRDMKRSRFIRMASLEDFFDCPDRKAKELVAGIVPFATVRYEPDADGAGMTAELTAGKFIAAEDYERIRQYLRPKLRYRWNGTKFDLEK